MFHPGPGQSEKPSQAWITELERYFSRGNNTRLPWPAGSMMVSEKHRVLYSPVAKCACTSLKTMMVNLAGVEHAEQIIKYGVHRVTDKFNTGMHLKDLPRARVMEIRTSDEFYKFAVIRNPVERIISAYSEKFVLNRHNKANQGHTGEVVRAVQGTSNPNMDAGISFRQFVEFITAQPSSTLDAHWSPQHLNLRGVSRYNRIFRVDQMNELQNSLEEWTGENISLGRLNKSATQSKDQHSGPDSPSETVVDLLPAALEDIEGLQSSMFMEADLVASLETYYAEDIALFNSTFSDTQGYTPPELVDMGVWRQVNIYTKGYLGVRNNGAGSVGIVIFNKSISNINNRRFPGLGIQYALFDSEGLELADARFVQALTKTIPAGDYLQINLEVSIPKPLLDSAAARCCISCSLAATRASAHISRTVSTSIF